MSEPVPEPTVPVKPAAAKPVPSRRRRILRALFRAARQLLLFLLLCLVGAAVYLHLVGLPDFLKVSLLERLKAGGLELQFSRLVLHWHRGFVAEDVQFGSARRAGDEPQLYFKELELKVSVKNWRRLEFSVDSLMLDDGRLAWVVSETNQPSQALVIKDIQARLRFLPNDSWALDHFSALFNGARLRLTGSLTNASSVHGWSALSQKEGGASAAKARQATRDFLKTVEAIKFPRTPELDVVFRGDGKSPETMRGMIMVRAPAAETPWGNLNQGFLLARFTAGPENLPPQAEFTLAVNSAETRWGSLYGLHAHATTNLVSARLEISAHRLTSLWARGTNISFTADWTHAPTNPLPLTGRGELRFADFHSIAGSVSNLNLSLGLDTPAGAAPAPADGSWGEWAKFAPYHLDWRLALRNLDASDLQLETVECGGFWRAPALAITNLEAGLYGGRVGGSAQLDVATRAVRLQGVTDFDFQKISHLLADSTQEQLAHFIWTKPPRGEGRVDFTLPAWTNKAGWSGNSPEWKEVVPTLVVDGRFTTGVAGYRKTAGGEAFMISSAESHAQYSNQVWHLPDLVVTRPEGTLKISHLGDDKDKSFYFHVQGGIEVKALRPLLDEATQKVLDFVELSRPPELDAEIRGNWSEPERLGFRAQAAAEKFTVRGETIDRAKGLLEFTNLTLRVTDGRLERGTGIMTAPLLFADFTAHTLFVTNGFSTVEPAVLLRAIGPKTYDLMRPYQFLDAPTVHANGIIPLADGVRADLHFSGGGGRFHWTKFSFEHFAGTADWVGDRLFLSNGVTEFYGGTLTGSAAFDLSPAIKGADFSLDLNVADAELQQVMVGLFNQTNRLEGKLAVRLNVTSANSEDFHTWMGDGWVSLHNGFIWEIPIFGIFTPVLNGIAPRLGESTATEGSASYTITNGVFRTDNLEVHSPAVRMVYRGTVDFDGTVNAKVEARLLRDLWGLGQMASLLFSPVTKIFEYKITGTLGAPKKEPLFVFKLKEFLGDKAAPPPGAEPPKSPPK